ncbi:MAG: indolepyruvate oxidoreductase subunit IorA [Oligoflexia bacterium]|nr:MAG: indolepyruvate oxidoreductase subunit IorA [Oligoflexia bacterium]
MNEKQVLALGAEAVAMAAFDCGVQALYGYPGTPSTEVFEKGEELFSEDSNRKAIWAPNEKVALEMGLGSSYLGKRAMVTMKHVGLNVAMDPFVNAAMTGVHGGLIVLVADDPGMHSSQNEQDSRFLADFANVPCFEPTTIQECYDLLPRAFEISEKMQLPILFRLVTRLSHARGVLNRHISLPLTNKGIVPDSDLNNWILIPAYARKQYEKLRTKMDKIVSQIGDLNFLSLKSEKIGVILAGQGKANLDQVASEVPELQNYSQLVVKAYPLDEGLIKKLSAHCDKIYVFEESYPYLEDKARLLSQKAKIHGRRDHTIPFAGELNPLVIRQTLGFEIPVPFENIDDLPIRPPRFCDGCGHMDAYQSLNQALEKLGLKGHRVFGDVGCYTMGSQSPFFSIHTCVEMGASVGMTLGAANSGYSPAIGVIGDSTFIHSGLTSLVPFARSKKNVNLLIMDNRVVAMTGQQVSTGHDELESMLIGLGMKKENIHVLSPLPSQTAKNTEILMEVLKKDEPSVVLFRRECVRSLQRGVFKKQKDEAQA